MIRVDRGLLGNCVTSPLDYPQPPIISYLKKPPFVEIPTCAFSVLIGLTEQITTQKVEDDTLLTLYFNGLASTLNPDSKVYLPESRVHKISFISDTYSDH